MRLFVAIELSPDVRRALVRTRQALRRFDEVVRWVGEEQMHLTLKFLGEVADDDVPLVTEALSETVGQCRAMTVRTEGAGCFPERGGVRVVWVGLADDGGALRACQSRIEDALADVGYPKEGRPFAPHLTLGRVKDDCTNGRLRDGAVAAEVQEVEQVVDAVVLMQSKLTPGGAEYTQVARFQLGHVAKSQ